MDSPERDADSHIQLALEEPEAALGYIVGKRAGMPEGARIEIELTGPGGTTWFVSVADRARQVEALEDGPTVKISMPATTFLRLAGGRVDLAFGRRLGHPQRRRGLSPPARRGLAYMI